MAPSPAISGVLNEVGPRLRRLRTERGVTLAALAAATGISVSTLSRLESGRRRPSLELLLPIAQAHRVALDELVGAPETGDPRVRLASQQVHGMTFVPLTRQPGGLRAYKIVLPAGPGSPGGPGALGGAQDFPPGETRTHEGYEWLYVLAGRLRLVLAEHDLVMEAGEAAEFDTRLPHWFGSADEEPVEVLSLFGSQGERMHMRARPRARRAPPNARTGAAGAAGAAGS
jgi:transcriptional regulator with XRE-family HTH domain